MGENKRNPYWQPGRFSLRRHALINSNRLCLPTEITAQIYYWWMASCCFVINITISNPIRRWNLIWRPAGTRRIGKTASRDTSTRAIPSAEPIQPIKGLRRHRLWSKWRQPLLLRSCSRNNRWGPKIFRTTPAKIANRSRTGWWRPTATTTTTKRTEAEESLMGRLAARRRVLLSTGATGKSPAATWTTARASQNVWRVPHSSESSPTDRSSPSLVLSAPRRGSPSRPSPIRPVRVLCVNSAKVYCSTEELVPRPTTPHRPVRPTSYQWPLPVLDWTHHEIDPPLLPPAKWSRRQLRSCSTTSRWRKRSKISARRQTLLGMSVFFSFFLLLPLGDAKWSAIPAQPTKPSRQLFLHRRD